MLIREMTRESCVSFLKELRFGRIACAQGAQPYVTPFYFAHHGDFIYSFATVGKKISWMRANPLVCVEADKINSPQEWQTVVVFGRYEELLSAPEMLAAQVLAHDLLAKVGNWWEPGYAKTLQGGSERTLSPVYFRIAIDDISGRRGTPDINP
jgi:nitroimidazol reductase NimA-like FMN-containing flavoprotein (pyridoxamine 5'-phosphate oxidase superfamily)